MDKFIIEEKVTNAERIFNECLDRIRLTAEERIDLKEQFDVLVELLNDELLNDY